MDDEQPNCENRTVKELNESNQAIKKNRNCWSPGLVEDCTAILPGYFPGPKKVKAVKPAIEMGQHFYFLNEWLKTKQILKSKKPQIVVCGSPEVPCKAGLTPGEPP